MYKATTPEETAQHLTIRAYEEKENQLGQAYLVAKKYGKKAETEQARKEWQAALSVVVAVDQALTDFRENLRAAQK